MNENRTISRLTPSDEIEVVIRELEKLHTRASDLANLVGETERSDAAVVSILDAIDRMTEWAVTDVE